MKIIQVNAASLYSNPKIIYDFGFVPSKIIVIIPFKSGIINGGHALYDNANNIKYSVVNGDTNTIQNLDVSVNGTKVTLSVYSAIFAPGTNTTVNIYISACK